MAGGQSGQSGQSGQGVGGRLSETLKVCRMQYHPIATACNAILHHIWIKVIKLNRNGKRSGALRNYSHKAYRREEKR